MQQCGDLSHLCHPVQANFTKDGGQRPIDGREVYVFTVDPVSGEATQQVVRGATDYPVGFSMDDSTGRIIMATEKWDGGTVTGFVWYELDPVTCKAVLLGSLSRGSGESSAAYYSGFVTALSKCACLCPR